MKWLAVRCCCKPQKVLGFLQVPDDCRTDHRISLAPSMTVLSSLGSPSVERCLRETHDLTIGMYEARGGVETAVKSEDQPVEFWRRVSGFVEVRGN